MSVRTWHVPPLGIMMFDAYKMLWYGHYYTLYCQMVECVFDKQIARVDSLRYIQPLTWGHNASKPVIECHQISSDKCICTLFSDENKETLLNTATFFFSDLAMTRPIRQNVPTTTRDVATLESFRVYSDMLTKDGHLHARHVFDWFEQVRTNVFGGQPTLRKLFEIQGQSIVVAKVENLQFHNVALSPNGLNRVVVVTAVCTLNRTLLKSMFQMTQQICLNDGTVLCQADVTLCCKDNTTNKVSRLSDDMLQSLHCPVVS